MRRGLVSGRRGEQRLHLGDQRSLALDGHGDAGAGHRLDLLGEEQPARVGEPGDAVVGEVEAADLVGRAEAVLDAAHHAQPGVAVALEVQHDVDEVLEHAAARRSSRPW